MENRRLERNTREIDKIDFANLDPSHEVFFLKKNDKTWTIKKSNTKNNYDGHFLCNKNECICIHDQCCY